MPEVRVLLIVNETASSVTARRRVLIQRMLAADNKLEVAGTSRRGHAARIARGAALDGVDVVAVLAGDGTLNEAADGLAGSRTALAPLPGGSTNVFARSIGVRYDAVEAAEQLVTSLRGDRVRRIGLGAANGRRFLFNAGAGFDAAVIARVERWSVFKRHFAHPMFVFATLDEWFRHDRSHPQFRVELDDGEVVGDSAFAIVSNQRPWSYIGRRPLLVAPGAGLDVPLTLTLFRSLDASLMLGGFGSALHDGRLLARHPKVAQRTGVTSLTVIGYRPFPWQVDGDYLGETEKLRVTWEPDLLSIVVP